MSACVGMRSGVFHCVAALDKWRALGSWDEHSSLILMLALLALLCVDSCCVGVDLCVDPVASFGFLLL